MLWKPFHSDSVQMKYSVVRCISCFRYIYLNSSDEQLASPGTCIIYCDFLPSPPRKGHFSLSALLCLFVHLFTYVFVCFNMNSYFSCGYRSSFRPKVYLSTLLPILRIFLDCDSLIVSILHLRIHLRILHSGWFLLLQIWMYTDVVSFYCFCLR